MRDRRKDTILGDGCAISRGARPHKARAVRGTLVKFVGVASFPLYLVIFLQKLIKRVGMQILYR